MPKSLVIIGAALVTLSALPVAAQEKLDRIVERHLQQVAGYLDKAEKAVERKDAKNAASLMGEAEMHWKTFNEWNAGKFDPNHPDVAAVAARMKSVKESVDALTGKAGDMADVLPRVLGVIAENEGELKAAISKGRMALQSFRSETWEYGRIEAARAKLTGVSLAVGSVHDLLPATQAAAREFRRQFPDFEELKKLVRNGWQAAQAVERVEGMPADWLEELSRVTKECLDQVEKNIGRYEKELGEASDADEQQKESVAGHAFEWAVDHADMLLGLVPMAFPELSKEARSVLPEFVAARDAFRKRAASLETRRQAVEALVGLIRKDVVAAGRRRLEAARFPKTEHHGGDWDEAEKAIRMAWNRRVTDKVLVKIAIHAPWRDRTETHWRDGHWIIRTYRYLGAYCLGQRSADEYWVYRITFRMTRQPDGSWGRLEYWAVGHVYPILAENIDK